MSNLLSLGQFWWVRIPALLGRATRLLSTIASDGAYLRAWPPLAALAPVVCLLVGLLSGWWHFSPGLTYTHAIGLMAIFVLLSGLGAGLGFWLLMGYVLGDFVLYGHQHPYDSSLLRGVLFVRLSLVIAYVLLAKLVCLTPLISRGLRQQVLGRLKLAAPMSTVMHAVVQGALQAALTWVWVQATPTLIRPVYTWLGNSPPVDAMRPLQLSGTALVALAFALGIARAALESLPAAQRASISTRAELQRAQAQTRPLLRAALPSWLAALLRAAFATFMMAGIIDTWLEASAFFALITGAQLLRGFIATRAVALVEWMGRVPIILRMVAGSVVSYLVASVLIPAFWSGGNTFLPVLMTVTSSMIVFSLLLPLQSARPTEVRA